MAGSDQVKKNTKDEKTFFTAIRQGSFEEVKAMVAKAPELLNAFNYESFGATPLTMVSFCGARQMMDVLLDLGVDINRRSDWQLGPWSPLHTVIFGGDDELTEYLLDRGAELDVHTAASLGRLDDINRLLDQSPERIAEQGGDGCHPLHFAGTPAAADLLLERGADIEARCLDHYSTPVQYLCNPRPEVARHLFSKGAVADIFSATVAGDKAVVEQLIADDKGVLDSRISQETFPPGPEHDVHNMLTFIVGGGCTPLHAAAKGNQPDFVHSFAQSGANMNVRGGYDDSAPLHIAAWEDHLDAAVALAEEGANIDLKSGEIHNNTPAGWAIVAGSCNVFEMLMDRGAEVRDFFLADAQAATKGEFRQFKNVPQENYDRILARIQSAV